MISQGSADTESGRTDLAQRGPAGPPPKKTLSRKKVGTDLVVLSSVAILSVYGIGYQRTLAGANAIASLDSSSIDQASAAVASLTPVATAIPVASAQVTKSQDPTSTIVAATPTASGSDAAGSTVASTPSAVPTATTAAKVPMPAATVAKAGQFRDGSYVGQGFSRHGGIEATVVIAGGKIVSADITQCSTRYPCSDVDPLIPEVVTRQAAPIHHISGASDSSKAYHDAIVKALVLAV